MGFDKGIDYISHCYALQRVLIINTIFFVKVWPPLEIEPATSNAGGIESTIGLLGCSFTMRYNIYFIIKTHRKA